MLTKISSLIMAIYLFLVGLIYGDQPIRVECTYDIPSEVTVYEQGEWVCVTVTATNVGRPFKGEEPFNVNVSFFRTVDGMELYLPIEVSTDEEQSKPTLIKKGDINLDIEKFRILEDAIPGSYDMRVTCEGCSQIFEDVIVVK